jgi:hypothetical protein
VIFALENQQARYKAVSDHPPLTYRIEIIVHNSDYVCGLRRCVRNLCSRTRQLAWCAVGAKFDSVAVLHVVMRRVSNQSE